MIRSSRALLISNSQHKGYPYMGHAEKHIREFLADRVTDVLFVPYAAILFPYSEYAEKVGDRFRDFGYSLKSLHEAKDPIAAIASAGPARPCFAI